MIHLGDLVRDIVTGYEGIVIGITEYLNGCRRPIVQPTKLKEDGTPYEGQAFDEEQLEVVETGRLKLSFAQTGGPEARPKLKATPKR